MLRRPLADSLEAVVLDLSVSSSLHDLSEPVSDCPTQFDLGRLKQTAIIKIPTKFLNILVVVVGVSVLCLVLSAHLQTAAHYARIRDSEKAVHYVDPALECFQRCWKAGPVRPETRLSCASECLLFM